MNKRPSYIALLVSGLLITAALFGKLADRRLAAEWDDWIRSDSTLTAHTVYCEHDAIQLECPPPWLKWYEIDFMDLETGESIFADHGNSELRAFSVAGAGYQHPKLDRGPFRAAREGETACIARIVISLRAENDTTGSSANKQGIMIWAEKYADIAPFSSTKIMLESYVERNSGDGNAERLARISKTAENIVFQQSPAGNYEQQYPLPGPDTDPQPGTYFIRPSCKWSKGLWNMHVFMVGTTRENSEDAVELLSQVRDRIMQYYRELNSRYAEDTL